MKVYVVTNTENVHIVYKNPLALLSHLQEIEEGKFQLQVGEMDDDEYEQLHARTSYSMLLQTVGKN